MSGTPSHLLYLDSCLNWGCRMDILSVTSIKRWRIHLMRVCHVYIIHFVVLHPFPRRRPQIWLTFTRQMTLIKSDLRKQIAFSLEYSWNNSILLVYIPNCSGYLSYMLPLSFFIVITLNMVCVYYCCKFSVIKEFLPTSSSNV